VISDEVLLCPELRPRLLVTKDSSIISITNEDDPTTVRQKVKHGACLRVPTTRSGYVGRNFDTFEDIAKREIQIRCDRGTNPELGERLAYHSFAPMNLAFSMMFGDHSAIAMNLQKIDGYLQEDDVKSAASA
jgi:hypothetical protein